MDFERHNFRRVFRRLRTAPKATKRQPLDWPHWETLGFVILAGFVAGLLI